MPRALAHIADADLPVAGNELQADFNCVYKLPESVGWWTVVGTDLDLGVNEPFRGFIVAATERTGIEPACLAALIDIEAAKTAAGQWDPNSANRQSSARGLTQFLQATWLDLAGQPSTYLASVVRERNLAGDDNAILDLRFDAQCSIMAAADYGAINLPHLAAAGLVPADAGDAVKARLMYLAHHDGLGGAEAWLRGQVGEDDARQKLVAAAGTEPAEQAKAGHPTWAEAYLAWIYSKVRPEQFGS